MPINTTPNVDPTCRLFTMVTARTLGQAASWADMVVAGVGEGRWVGLVHRLSGK